MQRSVEIRPAGPHTIDVHFRGGDEIKVNLRAPESLGISRLTDPASGEPEPWRCWGGTTLFRFDRPSEAAYEPDGHSGWVLEETVPACRFISRVRAAATGERIDFAVAIANTSEEAWLGAGYNPCVGYLPEPFQDPGLTRMFVIDREGVPRVLGDRVENHDYNVVSLADGPEIALDETMPPEWWKQDLKLGEPLIMSRSRDGRRMLLHAFLRPGILATGYVGPCMHSIGRTGRLDPGASETIHGFLALIDGDESAGLEYYRRWIAAHPWV